MQISGVIPTGMKITTVKIHVPHRWWKIEILRIETSFGIVVRYDGDKWASVSIPAVYGNCVEGTLIQCKINI